MRQGHAPREFTLVETSDAVAVANALHIAFASSDQHYVDQHFGSACKFAVFEVTADAMHMSRVINFEPAVAGHSEDKLADRIGALAGCDAVYCCAVGASAISQLTAKGVQPIKTAQGSAIRAEIALVQEALNTRPAPWMKRAQRPADADTRFDDMEKDGWVE